MQVDAIKAMIRDAFASVTYPGDLCLRGSSDGEEPYLLEREFAGKTDWRTLDAAFLDNAPDGFATALSFFSDEAMRFYLPAYLLADLDERLQRVEPAFHLTHGLTAATREQFVNPRRYGTLTWSSAAVYRLSIFDAAQSEAIVAYLECVAARDEFSRNDIADALPFWRTRAAGSHLSSSLVSRSDPDGARPEEASDDETASSEPR